MKKTFWVCAERYRGSGRLSRTWVVGPQEERPDEMEECTGQYSVCSDNRAPWAHTMAHTPYPFNGMGGEVVSGHFYSLAAEQAEAALWD
jgi:hypothetical protein